MRDYQRSKVYAWENKYVHPHDNLQLTFEQCCDLVDFVWSQLGYNNPPKVKKARRNRKRCSTGYRLEITLLEHHYKTSVVLHELAHSILETGEGSGDGHGPEFVATYVDLLERFMRLPKPMLWYTLKQSGVDFNIAPSGLKS